MARKRYQGQNLYRTRLTTDIPPISTSGDPLTVFDFDVLDPPVETKGWVIVDFTDDTRRDLIYYHNRVGNKLYYYRKDRDLLGNGATSVEHNSDAFCQINDVSQWIDYIFDNLEDFGRIENRGTNKLKIYGGYLWYNNQKTLINDTNDILLLDGTHYAVFDYSDGSLKTVTDLTGFVGLTFAEIVVSLGNITSIIDKRGIEGHIDFHESYFEFVNGLLEPKDSGVNAGSYTNANIVVDSKGRVVSASDGSIVPGSASYTHIQASPSNTWNIVHNLNIESLILDTYENDDERVVPDSVEILNSNEVRVTFTSSISGKCVVLSAGANLVGGYIVVEDEGVPLPQRSAMNFVGDGVTVTDVGGKTRIFVPGNSNVTYPYTQSTPSNTWVINHNLNSERVVVGTYNNNDQLIQPDTVTINDANTVTLTFTAAIEGKALIMVAGGVASVPGEPNNGVNIGTGVGKVFRDKQGFDLRFKSITAGNNINITNNVNDIIIESTASGGQIIYDAIVDSTGSGDYLTLKAAIDDGNRKILIRSGIYNEIRDNTFVIENESLVIHGEGDVRLNAEIESIPLGTFSYKYIFLFNRTISYVNGVQESYSRDIRNINFSIVDSGNNTNSVILFSAEDNGTGTRSSSNNPNVKINILSSVFKMVAGGPLDTNSKTFFTYLIPSSADILLSINAVSSTFIVTDDIVEKNIRLNNAGGSVDNYNPTFIGCVFNLYSNYEAGSSKRVSLISNGGSFQNNVFYLKGGDNITDPNTELYSFIRFSGDSELYNCQTLSIDGYAEFLSKTVLHFHSANIENGSYFNEAVPEDLNDWATSTSYLVGDYVKSTSGQRVYRCLVSYTSSSNPNDELSELNGPNWVQINPLVRLSGKVVNSEITSNFNGGWVSIAGDSVNSQDFIEGNILDISSRCFVFGSEKHIVGNNMAGSTTSNSFLSILGDRNVFTNNQLYRESSSSFDLYIRYRGNYNHVSMNTLLKRGAGGTVDIQQIGAGVSNVEVNNIEVNNANI